MGQTEHWDTAEAYIADLRAAGLFVKTDLTDREQKQPVRGFTSDSREASEGGLFVVKGAHFQDAFLLSAMNAGSVAYVAERVTAGQDRFILVSDVRRAMPILAARFYRHPEEKLTLVGITGTKGKSTVTYYMKAVCEADAQKRGKPSCGFISSIDTYDGVERFESHMTTPEAPELFRHFSHAVQSGLDTFVMEVSSQALKYHRVDGIPYAIGCYTNIGSDHISPVEHPDFDDYFHSKCRLFDQCGTAVVNTDDAHSGEVLAYIGGRIPVVTYGSHETDDVCCTYIEKREGCTCFGVRMADVNGGQPEEYRLTMPGIFNVSNALATIAMCRILSIPTETVKEGLLHARAGGRMQIYASADRLVTVIVDYAHNQMSFQALYDSTEVEYPGAKMISVFGCPGGKALLRRRDLGLLSGQRCAYVVVTEEDSGEEPFASIAGDIARAVEEGGAPYEITENRGEAIRHAIFMDVGRRVILLTGKGEETRMKRGLRYEDFPSDVEFTLQYLREYDQMTAKAALIR